jgi:U3 small nucleolar ribonucleoprotein protein LCP5
MAVDSLKTLLDTLTQSLSSASQSTEKIPSLTPPKDGISLLDSKNELFLSYLQNLVFLILLKLRNRKSPSDEEDEEALDSLVVKKLVELTVYLERGALNLEGRLKYQIDKVLRAAQDAENAVKINVSGKPTAIAVTREGDSDEDEEDVSEEEEGGVTLKPSEIDDLQYRPNPAALIRPSAGVEAENDNPEDGLYKPPRIQATAMPTTERQEKVERTMKSATMQEFINEELSEAPQAQVSIGSNTIEGGRRTKTERERKDEEERREYEEKNYTRLPKQSKKELRKKRGKTDAGYGGEALRDLDEGFRRIENLTKRKSGEGRSVLEKSRKRPTEDGPRASGGVEVSQSVHKRVKMLDGGRKDRGRH